jgi:hypothetical protein
MAFGSDPLLIEITVEDHALNSVEFLRVVDDEAVTEDLPKLVNVVWNGWESLDIDLVCVSSSIELLVFEVLPNSVRRSLIRHSVFVDEYPQIDVTPSVSLTAGDTAVQHDSDDSVEFVEQLVDSGSDWWLELRLGDLQERIVRTGEPVGIDLDLSSVAIAAVDDEIVGG